MAPIDVTIAGGRWIEDQTIHPGQTLVRPVVGNKRSGEGVAVRRIRREGEHYELSKVVFEYGEHKTVGEPVTVDPDNREKEISVDGKLVAAKFRERIY